MAGPLRGIRVIESCSYISGPFAGKLLGDLGAEVIKVEQPGAGDPFRAWQSAARPFSPQFAAYNRNKKSLTLNLKTHQGLEIFLELARRADVVMENFRPGVADELGIGWEQLRPLNDHLIYCAITGFGSSGPYVHRPSYDSIASALSGFYSMLFDPRNPVPVGPPFSDLMSGMFAAQGILAALVARAESGRGQRLEVSMLGAMLGYITEAASTFLDLGEVPGPDTRPRRAQVYAFVARDGLPFIVHLSSPPKFWQALAAAVGKPELVDNPRFKTRDLRFEHYYELDAILKEAMRQRPRAEWFRILEELDVPHAPLYRMDEVFDDPQVRHMDMVDRVELPGYGTMRMAGYPIELSETPCETIHAPPLLGQHNGEVLSELGYTPNQITALQAERAI